MKKKYQDCTITPELPWVPQGSPQGEANDKCIMFPGFKYVWLILARAVRRKRQTLWRPLDFDRMLTFWSDDVQLFDSHFSLPAKFTILTR